MDHQEIQASGFVVQPRLQFKHLRDELLFLHFMKGASYRETNDLQIGQLFIRVSDGSTDRGWPRKGIRGWFRRVGGGGRSAARNKPCQITKGY